VSEFGQSFWCTPVVHSLPSSVINKPVSHRWVARQLSRITN